MDDHRSRSNKQALNQKVGIIGICLGARLLAYAAGGDVEVLFESRSRQPLVEIGWHPVSSHGYKKTINFQHL